MHSINIFQPRFTLHIEINRLFCSARQMTGVYIKRNTGLKWVNPFVFLHPIEPTIIIHESKLFPHLFLILQISSLQSDWKEIWALLFLLLIYLIYLIFILFVFNSTEESGGVLRTLSNICDRTFCECS